MLLSADFEICQRISAAAIHEYRSLMLSFAGDALPVLSCQEISMVLSIRSIYIVAGA